MKHDVTIKNTHVRTFVLGSSTIGRLRRKPLAFGATFTVITVMGTWMMQRCIEMR